MIPDKTSGVCSEERVLATSCVTLLLEWEVGWSGDGGETSSWETAVQDFCWPFYFLRHSLGAGGRTWLSCAVPGVSKAHSAQEAQIILLFCPLLQEEKAKAYKKEKQREKKRRAEEELTFEEDDEMAAVMGFSGFGSTKKNH